MKVVDESRFRGRVYVFKDRVEAGRILAQKIKDCLGLLEESQVLAVPAGGVPVGYVVAKVLGLPFDVVVVRNIQVPWNTEAGFGALSWNGSIVISKELVEDLGLTKKVVDECILKTGRIVEERLKKFRGVKPFPNLKDKTVILVDDGLATGFTMVVAVQSVKKHKPKKIIVATPTASINAVELVASYVDMLLCLNIRSGLVFAVADAYQEWYDLTDEEVIPYIEGKILLNL